MRMYSVIEGTTESSHSPFTKDFSFETSISSSFRIDLAEGRLVVARACDRFGVDERVEPGDRFRAQTNLRRANVICQMIEPRSARNGNDVLALGQDPSKSQLRNSAVD